MKRETWEDVKDDSKFLSRRAKARVALTDAMLKFAGPERDWGVHGEQQYVIMQLTPSLAFDIAHLMADAVSLTTDCDRVDLDDLQNILKTLQKMTDRI